MFLFWIPLGLCSQHHFLATPEKICLIGLTSEELNAIKTDKVDDQLLQVYVGDTIPETDAGIPSVMGKLTLADDTLIFQPAFLFRYNQPYTAIFNKKELFHFTHGIPASLPQPTLTALFPSADTLPANQLKFYLYFSSPMREGFAYQYVRVTDTSGQLLASPFVPLQPELWDSTHTRLTLWLDPGRVKRGLASNQQHGEVLTPHQSILIEIDSTWKDIYGQSLPRAYSFTYHIGDYDRNSPQPQDWQLILPKAHTQTSLHIQFGESLDRALLNRCISVLDSHNQLVSGQTRITEAEKGWSFIPDAPWKVGTYYVLIESRLEDLAGNNLNRLFDTDLQQKNGFESAKTYHTIGFEVSE